MHSVYKNRINLRVFSKPAFVVLAFSLGASAFAQVVNPSATEIDQKNISTYSTYTGEPIRLSQWLNEREKSGLAKDSDYLLGLSWMTPEELKLQQKEFAELGKRLDNLQKFKSWNYAVTSRVGQDKVDELRSKQKSIESTYAKLKLTLNLLKPTGKVRTAGANAKWLEVNPKKDPVLNPGDKISIPTRPSTVLVMSANGTNCEAPHKSGLHARDYINACQTELNGAWAWIVQPDGRVSRVGLSQWNPSQQMEPPPGAGIWAP